MQDKYMNIHFRLYDKNIVKMVKKILLACPKEFKSKEDLCKKATQREIKRLYNEIAGTDNVQSMQVDEADIMVRLEQAFVLLHIILNIVSATLNIETDKLSGDVIVPENIESGIYDELPKRFEKLLKSIIID